MRGKLFSIFTLLLLALTPMISHAVLIDKISAVVNNDVILLSEIDRFEKTLSLRRELDPLFGFSDELEKGYINRKAALDFLIQEKLIIQTFKVADSEVEQEIQNIQRMNNLDREQLVEFLKTKGFSFNEYFELMRVGLAKRNLMDREIRSRVNISDDDVRNYFFNMAQKNSAVPLEYNLQIIVVNNRTYKSAQAAQDAAENALKSIKEGESFAEVAKRVSDDASAGTGGELGYLSAENLAEPLRPIARKLQIGEVSNLVKSPNGFMIVRLIDARSAESQKLNEMKDSIREKLGREESKRQLFMWAERARNSAYVRIN